MSDGSGDRLTGRLDEPFDAVRASPLILLIHGLTGCEDSSYMRASSCFHQARGRRVLRLNLRGAGTSRNVAAGYYHAGCATDIQDVLGSLKNALVQHGVFLIGFSLGGNILLNLLHKADMHHSVVGAATVSAPIEPAQACQRMMEARNWIYHQFLLSRMKRDVLASTALSMEERRHVASASSIRNFDDKWVAPRHGFRDAADYYERTAGAQFVSKAQVPTLMVHARNDPWIPLEPYLRLRKKVLPNVQMLIAQGGGHLGFHERGHSDTWHDRMIDNFIRHLARCRHARG